jgi:hypothetical protein
MYFPTTPYIYASLGQNRFSKYSELAFFPQEERLVFTISL